LQLDLAQGVADSAPQDPPLHAAALTSAVVQAQFQMDGVVCCTAGSGKLPLLMRSVNAALSAAAVRPERASLHGPARFMPTGGQ